ncbi:MAG: HAMP domain-containing histidine kinase [Gemmatimonadetes bacterium]|nr:HAMP domain-containing histidine kinase [Gemmatimonadota bacterium]
MPWLAGAELVVGGLAGAVVVHWLAERRMGRFRREFAQGVSHEMRTSLTHIRLFTEMLQVHGEPADAEQRRWLGVIEREALRLGDMVENLLDFAHDAGPEAYPAREPVELGALLEDTAAACAPLAAARGMRIEADPPAGVVAAGSARALRQAVANLLDNAVRHGAPGQTITLSLHTEPGRAVVAVTDQGLGVPAADRTRIWEPFAQAGETGGIGLGLALVRRVATAHGGEVFVDDPPGGGARFGMVLPRVEA